jgi:hypothetical protein
MFLYIRSPWHCNLSQIWIRPGLPFVSGVVPPRRCLGFRTRPTSLPVRLSIYSPIRSGHGLSGAMGCRGNAWACAFNRCSRPCAPSISVESPYRVVLVGRHVRAHAIGRGQCRYARPSCMACVCARLPVSLCSRGALRPSGPGLPFGSPQGRFRQLSISASIACLHVAAACTHGGASVGYRKQAGHWMHLRLFASQRCPFATPAV